MHRENYVLNPGTTRHEARSQRGFLSFYALFSMSIHYGPTIDADTPPRITEWTCGYCGTIVTKTDYDEQTQAGSRLDHACTHPPHTDWGFVVRLRGEIVRTGHLHDFTRS